MSMLDAALAYAASGLHVFPLWPRAKTPVTQNGCKDATADEATVRGLWTDPARNIGIATGFESGVFVLDVDGEQGELTLRSWEAAFGALPPTWTVRTARGMHLWFRHPGEQCALRNSAGKHGDGIDVRTDGGYVVAPPSVHPNGDTYTWADGRRPSDLPLAYAPDWLLKRLTDKPKLKLVEPPVDGYGGHTRYGQRALDEECMDLQRTPEGQRNSKLNLVAFRVGQLVTAGHLQKGSALSDVRRSARACGLEDGETEATIASGFKAGSESPNRNDPRPERYQPRSDAPANDTREEPPETEADAEQTAERKPLAITLTAEETAMHALKWLADEARAKMPRSGYDLLDRAIGGLPPGAMLTVGGRTGSGKSSLLLGMAMHQSRQQALKVGIVSCEDPEWVWGSRIISVLQGVNPEAFFGKEPDPYIVGKARVAVNEARNYGLHFSFQIGRKINAVVAAVKELVLGKGCNVIMVDYLQAIAAPGANRYEARTDHAQELKGFCHSQGVPLVLASQLKRPEGGAVGKEPNSNDLKDSGDVENMSEAVILLWPVSDEENAPTLGKVSKVKWSPKRTKFALERNPDSGALAGLSLPPLETVGAPVSGGFKRRQSERREGWYGRDE